MKIIFTARGDGWGEYEKVLTDSITITREDLIGSHDSSKLDVIPVAFGPIIRFDILSDRVHLVAMTENILIGPRGVSQDKNRPYALLPSRKYSLKIYDLSYKIEIV